MLRSLPHKVAVPKGTYSNSHTTPCISEFMNATNCRAYGNFPLFIPFCGSLKGAASCYKRHAPPPMRDVIPYITTAFLKTYDLQLLCRSHRKAYTITRKIWYSVWSDPLGLLCWKCFTWAIRRRRSRQGVNLNIVLQSIVLLWACGKNTVFSV